MGIQKTQLKAGAKNAPAKIAYVLPWFIIVVLLLVIGAVSSLLLYLSSMLSIENNFSRQFLAVSFRPQVLAAVINRNSSQPPQQFPESLILDKLGNFLSDQQITNDTAGSLKFLSFKSQANSERAYQYYFEYLRQQSYEINEARTLDQSWMLIAQRGKLAVDLHVQPAPEGSIVSIYYRKLE